MGGFPNFHRLRVDVSPTLSNIIYLAGAGRKISRFYYYSPPPFSFCLKRSKKVNMTNSLHPHFPAEIEEFSFPSRRFEFILHPFCFQISAPFKRDRETEREVYSFVIIAVITWPRVSSASFRNLQFILQLCILDNVRFRVVQTIGFQFQPLRLRF